MAEKLQVREGMKVHAPSGAVLGRVTAIGDAHFEVEPGLFTRKDFRVAMSHVASVREGHLVLAHGWEDLQSAEFDDGSAVPPRASEHIDDEGMIHAASTAEPAHG